MLKSVKMATDKKNQGGFEQGHHKSFMFKANDAEELDRWVRALPIPHRPARRLAPALTVSPPRGGAGASDQAICDRRRAHARPDHAGHDFA